MSPLLERAEADLKRSRGWDRDNFRDFHVDRSMVDWIHVYSGEFYDRATHFDADEGACLSDENYRRQGLVSHLYRIGALWMAENDMALHTSEIQEPAARSAWEAMERDGYPVREESLSGRDGCVRKILDYRDPSFTPKVS